MIKLKIQSQQFFKIFVHEYKITVLAAIVQMLVFVNTWGEGLFTFKTRWKDL